MYNASSPIWTLSLNTDCYTMSLQRRSIEGTTEGTPSASLQSTTAGSLWNRIPHHLLSVKWTLAGNVSWDMTFRLSKSWVPWSSLIFTASSNWCGGSSMCLPAVRHWTQPLDDSTNGSPAVCPRSWRSLASHMAFSRSRASGSKPMRGFWKWNPSWVKHTLLGIKVPGVTRVVLCIRICSIHASHYAIMHLYGCKGNWQQIVNTGQ